MALFDVVRKVVQQTMPKILKSFEGEVTITPWIGQDGKGADVYGTPFTAPMIIDLTKQQRYTMSGVLVMTYATLTALRPIADTAETDSINDPREQPIDPRDRIVLPDGGTSPIVQTGGPLDPQASRPVFNEIILGSIVRGQ